jgi:Tartrate dehydratase alpha subunit/Fumarate hydratase class I, N-terminal domain
MREISTDQITEAVAKICIEANLKLSEEMEGCIRRASDTEKNPLAQKILGQLKENMDIARENTSRLSASSCR